MTGFELSPGITPGLTGAVSILIPLALGLGAFAAGRRGFAVALGIGAVALGVIKIVTDFTDPPDVLVAAAGIVAGVVWAVHELRPFLHGRLRRGLGGAVGALAFVVGAIKLRDFYDPFDLVLADLVVLGGVALLLVAFGRLATPGRASVRSEPSTGPRRGGVRTPSASRGILSGPPRFK